MTIDEFNNMPHHANMWCRHEGKTYYIVSSNFDQALFGLIPHKEPTDPEEWQWVRCENVEMIEAVGN